MVCADEELVQRLERLLKAPVFFRDVLAGLSDNKYRAILCAWSDVRSRFELSRDEAGRYWISPP
jgi:hypothetical protein